MNNVQDAGHGHFVSSYLDETIEILQHVDRVSILGLVQGLVNVKQAGGRLFVLGVGGSAGHATHTVNDLRKICQLEAYAPSDNICELTARINDDGWDSAYAAWLEGSRLRPADGLLILSVGGGDRERNVSMNLVRAMEYARSIGAPIFGVVGRDGGHTAKVAQACVVLPPRFTDRITPHTEGLCSVIMHLVVSHPLLKQAQTKWEATVAQ